LKPLWKNTLLICRMLSAGFYSRADSSIIDNEMTTIKRQDLPTGLWVVATPIGNLGDLSERARAALKQADAILCEDTRRTANLLAALNMNLKVGSASVRMPKLERLDAHATPGRLNAIVERLRSGESFAMVTDAGTPGISDPGAVLVSLARKAGIPITPVPGPSALSAFLSVSGIQETGFTFRGFFPRSKGDRIRELELIQETEISTVFVWFESPERIVEAIELISEEIPDCHIVAAKELSKIYERFFAGEAPRIADAIREEVKREGARGEWCFLVSLGGVNSKTEVQQKSSEWVKALQCLLEVGASASDAAKQISRHFDVSRNEVYESALRLLGKKK